MPRLQVASESWPIKGHFTISRGSKTSAEVIVVTLSEGEHCGRGECVPYARYGESSQSVMQQIDALANDIEHGLTREQLQKQLAPGAARNALDCAYWDLQAKQTGRRVWELLGDPAPQALVTAYTLSLDTAEHMHTAAQQNAHRPLLKLKLAGAGDIERVSAVRAGAPSSRLVVDANEGWNEQLYSEMVPELMQLGVEMIEQPLPADNDAILADLERPIRLCADESCHTSDGLDQLVGKYDMVNIKLDKTGGLSAALELRHQAQAHGMGIMVGCMLATSLAMAPATLLAQGADIVDLDGPLLLARDRHPGLEFDNNLLHPPSRELWG